VLHELKTYPFIRRRNRLLCHQRYLRTVRSGCTLLRIVLALPICHNLFRIILLSL
jgi:hypothetical protein